MRGGLHTVLFMAALLAGCAEPAGNRLTVVAPGHFHAALLQKESLEGVNDTVKVYAPRGPELDSYLETVESFNTREDSPTSWVEDVYAGDDFLEKLPEAGKGGFVILSGNNRDKARYIIEAVRKGYNVLSDKPMAISSQDYAVLKEAYSEAAGKGTVVYDLMTERYEVLNVLAKEFLSDRRLFPTGADTVDIMDVHHFYKEVLGKPTLRPAWYYDVKQQGEGIADVTTHFIDLIFWELFPGEAVGTQSIENLEASHYPTVRSLGQYGMSTGETAFPDYLEEYADGAGNIEVMANGDIGFDVNGTHVHIGVRWDFMPEHEGISDSFCQRIRSGKTELRILQDARTGYRRELFISTADREALQDVLSGLSVRFPELSAEDAGEGCFRIVVPSEYRSSHEDHFSKVARRFISLVNGEGLPEWERTNTLTKYYITTEAVRTAERNYHGK